VTSKFKELFLTSHPNTTGTFEPLGRAQDLAAHPSMSHAYTSIGITALAQQAEELVHEEQTKLTDAKLLLEKFMGDDSWAPCGSMETADDMFYFGPIAQHSHKERPTRSMNGHASAIGDDMELDVGTGSHADDDANVDIPQHLSDDQDTNKSVDETVEDVSMVDAPRDAELQTSGEGGREEHKNQPGRLNPTQMALIKCLSSGHEFNFILQQMTQQGNILMLEKLCLKKASS
jgi:RXT2-like, N-terminal